MAKVKIQGNASGTGVVTLTAPNTNSDRTITLPDGTGELLAKDSSGKVGIGTSSPGSNLHVKGNGGVARFEGSDHAYMEWYPKGASNGRKGYIGYGSPGNTDIMLYNENSGSNIQLGTAGTERMRIDSAGRVTMPYQPAFCVRHNYTSHTSLEGSPDFTNEDVDIGDNFNMSTNTFTAPVSGRYYFSYESLNKANNSTSYAFYQIMVNDIMKLRQHSDSSGHGNYYPLSVSGVVNLSANDTVYIHVYNGDGGVYSSSGYNNFSGYLIG